MAGVSPTTKKQDDVWDVPAAPTTCSRMNSMECWDYTIELECLQGPQDLQLAAELGKTLLERNKELESSLKHHQNVIEDQAQEIEYLTKQTVALREVNDSRLRIYEQLEVSIQDLERDKHRLAVENASEKKHIKTLCHTIETLETKCDDLNKINEDVRRLLEIEKRKHELLLNESKKKIEQNHVKVHHIYNDNDESNTSEPDDDEVTEIDTSKPENYSYAFKNQSRSTDVTDSSGNPLDFEQSNIDLNLTEENEELIRIMQELEKTKKCFISEQNRVAELEEQLAVIAQENHVLQSRLVQINTNEELKSVHEELSILEEVRQGQMCRRCLRGFDDKLGQDEESIITGTEDDDHSVMDSNHNTETPHIYRSQVTIKTSSPKPDLSESISTDPYGELIARYEALLKVQREHPSSHDEMLSGEFSSLNTKFTDEDGADIQKHKENLNSGARRKTCLRTPTDFSEAETLSSGFSDETSNKATQTDERPGAFLCTIGDGEDCKLSIYEDQTAIDSRFRFRPDHRELFRQIFTVLKKAAENRDEGEKLPLLDDTHPAKPPPTTKVPPVTPAQEEAPTEFGDDTQSMISSAVSEQSFAMSECITKSERKKIECQQKYVEKHGEQENKPPTGAPADGRILTPYKRQPLEYLSVSVNVNKKKSRRRRNRGSIIDAADRSADSSVIPSPPRIFASSGKKGRSKYKDWTPSLGQQGASGNSNSQMEWNGNSITIYNRSMQSPTPSTITPNQSGRKQKRNAEDTSSEIEFRPSPASQDLHKLKKLDLSYAEVLRRADQATLKQQNQRRK